MAGQLVIDSGDTAWMLVATALVMLMLLPGLALFYGGLVRAKNLLSVMSQVLGITAIAILSWVLWGYSLAFSGGNWLVGGLAKVGLAGIDADSAWPVGSSGKAIPELVFAAFQMSFAAITGALVIGALVERVRFAAIMLFAVAVADDRLRAARAHGVGGRRAAVRPRRDRFRGRHGGPHQRRHRGPGRGVLRGAADRPSEGSDAAAFAGADHGRRRAAVGRLVRVQCRLGARGERASGGGDGQHLRRSRRRAAGVDGRSSGWSRASRRCSAAHRARSRGWSR